MSEIDEDLALRDKILSFAENEATQKKIENPYNRARKADIARCRCRIRIPELRMELEGLQPICKEEYAKEKPDLSMPVQRIGAVTGKWGIPRLTPKMVINMPSWEQADCIKYLDRVLMVLAAEHGPYMVSSPVHVINYFTRNYVDLRIFCYDHPINELLPLIEDAIKSFMDGWKEWEQKNGSKITPPKRRRSDKIDFQLSVFDMATEGKTFQEIARHLKKRASTVKSAYFVAHSLIFGKPGKKKDSVSISFDYKTHTKKCRICLKATRVDELCSKARAYADQDYGSQKAITGYDTIADK